MSIPELEDPVADSQAERYGAGRMGDEEGREFEVLLLESPDLAREVDATHRIRDGLRELQARGEVDELLYGRRPRTSVFALAAGTLALLAAGALLLRVGHLRNPPTVHFRNPPTVLVSSLADFTGAASAEQLARLPSDPRPPGRRQNAVEVQNPPR